MLRTCRRFHHLPVARSPGIDARFSWAIHALVLIALCLLPVQMRAGIDRPHPHALFQLLLDASDGAIDHHASAHASHEEHQGAGGEHSSPAEQGAGQPDPPIYSDVIPVSASLAMLATIVALLTIPPPAASRIWSRMAAWQGRIPVLEPPPPRAV